MVTIGVATLADAGPVTMAVTDLADAGTLFPADLAGSVTVGVADFADAGILFPADPAGTVTADMTLLADDGLVTMGEIDLIDVGAVPLAVTDMTFPEIGLVNMEVVKEVNVTPMECRDGYGSFHGSTLTDMWCRDAISTQIGSPAMLIGSTTGDPLTVGTVGLDHDHWGVVGNASDDQVCPVVPEIYDLKQGNSVARDLPPTGSEANTTIFVLYILDIDSHCP